ncbi:thioredoxin family protein [Streptomyces caniscabiei]|uniref:thioredoxin n=1 Tax=Streptomyces caniscabiei TaxID=2746961 RepID=UPI0029B7FE7A|nr:thioredoxin family protein [Streptomyces caniscabiei]MDX2776068.1 thioredoxin family protein [Streptomyces caniscabiei]
MEFIRRHSKKLIILFILAAIAMSVLYLLLRPEAASTPSATNVPSSQAPAGQVETPKEVDTDVDTPGVYVDYSEAALADAKGTKLLFFHAPWCPQCRELDASIRSSALPDNLTILKVDYDTNQTLRQKYGVTLQTTLVQVDDTGEKIKSFVAYDSPTFDAVKAAFGL